MLIVCTGPDTYSARQKARELMQAFRDKYDPSGFSTEILNSPSLQDILNRLSAPSFFSSKRFIRADGLLASLKTAEVRTLVARIAADNDQTVLLTVEDEVPNEKVVGECKKAPFFHYAYPLLSGREFVAWCTKQADRLGATAKDAQEVAQQTEGDPWLAVQELSKRSANPQATIVPVGGEDVSTFEAVDACLLGRPNWRTVASQADQDPFLMTLVGQARSLIRTHDGETAGIHPFVVRKFSRVNVAHGSDMFLHSAMSLVATRTGLGTSTETQSVL